MSSLLMTDEEIATRNGREVQPGDVVWTVPEGAFDPNDKSKLRLAVVTNDKGFGLPENDLDLVMITGPSTWGFPLVPYQKKRLALSNHEERKDSENRPGQR